MKVESIAERSLGAFCNTFDLHLAISGLEKHFCLLFEGSLKAGFTVSGILRKHGLIHDFHSRVCGEKQGF